MCSQPPFAPPHKYFPPPHHNAKMAASYRMLGGAAAAAATGLAAAGLADWPTSLLRPNVVRIACPLAALHPYPT